MSSSQFRQLLINAGASEQLVNVALTDEAAAMAAGFSVVNNTATAIGVNNSTTTPLTAGSVFQGQWEVNNFRDVMISAFSDVRTEVLLEFSNDGGLTSFSNFKIIIEPGQHTFRVIEKGPRALRITLTNSPDTDQTTLDFILYYGTFRQPSSPLNAVIQRDADAIVTRGVSEELSIVERKLEGYSLVPKAGQNTDIDTGTLPEDIWDGGGVYPGFNASVAEPLEVFSSNNADTGVLRAVVLSSVNAQAYSLLPIQLNGTTPVVTSAGALAYFCHSAFYDTGTGEGFNQGTITVRQANTSANVFQIMRPGRSQTNSAAYRVPVNNTGYVKRRLGIIRGGSATNFVDGAFWTKVNGNSPRLRRPFTASGNRNYVDEIYSGFTVPAGSDIVPRAVSVGSNNTNFLFSYEMVLFNNG